MMGQLQNLSMFALTSFEVIGSGTYYRYVDCRLDLRAESTASS